LIETDPEEIANPTDDEEEEEDTETADSGNDMLMYIIAAVAGVLGAVILFSLLGSCKDKPDKKGEAR